MGKAAFLARRLTPAGCIVAGTKLAAHREALKAKKIKLAPKVETAVQSVIARTEAVAALGSTDATMTEIDRGTDRCISAFAAQLDGIERAFDHDDILPLDEDEAARRADAVLVRSEVLSSGTGFVKLGRRSSPIARASGPRWPTPRRARTSRRRSISCRRATSTAPSSRPSWPSCGPDLDGVTVRRRAVGPAPRATVQRSITMPPSTLMDCPVTQLP
ncbi:hypothetical protein [Sorangium sp. So ce341]|uniref:hypothetical protein n=1 Tax=Sorangium sp. So ce341 TaxID=3133302 RepID=UPI003F60D9B1